MNIIEIKKSVLEYFFQDECAIAGPNNIELIIEKKLKIDKSIYGSNMPIMDIISQIVTICDFIEKLAFSAISVKVFIDAYQKDNKQDDTIKKVTSSIKSLIDKPNEIDDENFDKIYNYIINKINSEKK